MKSSFVSLVFFNVHVRLIIVSKKHRLRKALLLDDVRSLSPVHVDESKEEKKIDWEK